MAYTKWNEKSLADYDNKVKNLIVEMEDNFDTIIPYIGKGNSKTKMVEEATSAGPCGTCSNSCIGNCREGCYAIVHQDGIYKKCREHHAANTVLRRHNHMAYYEVFFDYCVNNNKNLRVNESGDFDNENDVYALLSVAKRYPSVRVIGYTHRKELISVVAELNKLDNVTIHYSVGCSGDGMDEAKKVGVPTTTITFDFKKCNCPNQILKKNGKVWNCCKCAELKCGCFSKNDIFFMAH